MRTPVQALNKKRTLRLYVRQRQLLALLDVLGGNAGSRDFQKLLFLYCKELSPADQTSPYEFVPYRYGAFSFTCYADRRRLVDCGLLIDDQQHWALTEEGKRIARETQDGSMRVFAQRYHRLRGDALIAETYRKYPYYAIRSDIAEQVLENDEVALSRIESARPEGTPSRLLTIGYEGRTLESYLNALLQASVTVLCDVRRNAISRKYGFSKNALARACDGVGIRYEHLPELGIESRQRRGLESQADFDALFRTYERESLPRQGDALAKIRAWLRLGESVALTCYERDADQCHRHCVADALCQIFDQKDLFDQAAPHQTAEQSCTVRHL